MNITSTKRKKPYRRKIKIQLIINVNFAVMHSQRRVPMVGICPSSIRAYQGIIKPKWRLEKQGHFSVKQVALYRNI